VILEIFTCILIVAGMTAIMNDSIISVISVIGGTSLVMFGGLIFKRRKRPVLI